MVWAYLEKVIFQKNNLNILELNCGTGEDAIWFAKKGHKVWATDVSEKMIEEVKNKAFQESLSNEIYSQVIDIQLVTENFKTQKFDLVFSNFGGFNCLNEVEI